MEFNYQVIEYNTLSYFGSLIIFQGLIEAEKLDTFNLPYYTPTTEEVKKVIEIEGSFTLLKLEVFKMDWDSYIKKANSGLDKQDRKSVV